MIKEYKIFYTLLSLFFYKKDVGLMKNIAEYKKLKCRNCNNEFLINCDDKKKVICPICLEENNYEINEVQIGITILKSK